MHKILERIKLFIGLIGLLIISFPITPAYAFESNITLKSTAKFFGGILAAHCVHEGAHALVAEAYDVKLDWETGTYNQPIAFTEHADSDSEGLGINSAGLLAQVLGSETILQIDRIDKNDAFVRGMMAWNIINPILYAADYWFIQKTNQKTSNGGYQGDIQGIEYYSNESKANTFSICMVAAAAFQGYRFIKTQSWAPNWMMNKSYSLNFNLQRDGGFLFTFTFKF
ncbi:MAG: hypothetical protein GY797_32220 [Deltaproteobacteria bacterium]|nr:hypothetical protein [Deltaproteobacteria bacterium]